MRARAVLVRAMTAAAAAAALLIIIAGDIAENKNGAALGLNSASLLQP